MPLRAPMTAALLALMAGSAIAQDLEDGPCGVPVSGLGVPAGYIRDSASQIWLDDGPDADGRRSYRETCYGADYGGDLVAILWHEVWYLDGTPRLDAIYAVSLWDGGPLGDRPDPLNYPPPTAPDGDPPPIPVDIVPSVPPVVTMMDCEPPDFVPSFTENRAGYDVTAGTCGQGDVLVYSVGGAAFQCQLYDVP